MTVASSTDRATFLGNGTTTVFSLPFRFFANNEIQAFLVTNATGALTALTLGTHYTLVGAGLPEVNGNAASVLTMITAPTSLQSLFVQRIILMTQATDIVNQGRFFPEVHEDVFDRLTMLIQQNSAGIKGAIRVPDADPEPARLPTITVRADKLLSFDTSGNPIAVAAASQSATDLELRLANATDSTKGAALTGYKGRSVADVLSAVVDVKDFGATGDGVTNDHLAMTAAVTYAKTLVAPHFRIPKGEFNIGTGVLVLDLPDNSTISVFGRIVSSVVSGVAVRVGSSTVNRFGYKMVGGLDVRRSAYDTSSNSTGVQFRNVVFFNATVQWCSGFTDGVVCFADQGNGGVSHGHLNLGYIQNNLRGLRLSSVTPGYINENNFFGGSFSHTSDYPATAGRVGIQIDHNPVNQHNNNRFFGPSLEDGRTDSVAAIINGYNNTLYQPRLENPDAITTYPIILDSNSNQCGVLGNSYGVYKSNIQNNGTDNILEYIEGSHVTRATQPSDALQTLRSSVSGLAKLIRGMMPDGVTEGYSFTGGGKGFVRDVLYSENGLRCRTSDSSNNDRGLFFGIGSPEGVLVAGIGSLYCNLSGGANTTLYVKEANGTLSTGWTAK